MLDGEPSDNPLGRILIVDDREESARIMAVFLAEEGHEVEVAHRGKVALNMIAENQPDLVILDVMMPGMSGLEVLEELRSHPETVDLPVIVVTALSETANIVKGIELGATDYLPKPPRFEILLARVRTQIRLKQLQDQRKGYMKRLQELDAIKDRFLQIAAHDLKNPLNNIIVGLELLDRFTAFVAEKERGDYVQIIEMMMAASYTMDNLIKDFLDLNALQYGQLELDREWVSPNRIAKDTLAQFQAYAREKHLDLVTTLDSHMPDCFVDRDRISQVFSNLVGNAIKFSPPGATVAVRTSVLKDGHSALIEVEDNGPGIPPEEQPDLFKPFASISNTPTGKEVSTGIGLSIARQLVEMHGGEIGVLSTRDKGSTFWFTLPVEHQGAGAE